MYTASFGVYRGRPPHRPPLPQHVPSVGQARCPDFGGTQERVATRRTLGLYGTAAAVESVNHKLVSVIIAHSSKRRQRRRLLQQRLHRRRRGGRPHPSVSCAHQFISPPRRDSVDYSCCPGERGRGDRGLPIATWVVRRRLPLPRLCLSGTSARSATRHSAADEGAVSCRPASVCRSRRRSRGPTASIDPSKRSLAALPSVAPSTTGDDDE